MHVKQFHAVHCVYITVTIQFQVCRHLIFHRFVSLLPPHVYFPSLFRQSFIFNISSDGDKLTINLKAVIIHNGPEEWFLLHTYLRLFFLTTYSTKKFFLFAQVLQIGRVNNEIPRCLSIWKHALLQHYFPFIHFCYEDYYPLPCHRQEGTTMTNSKVK